MLASSRPAAVTSWQDLAFYLIKRLCGPQHAIRTAKVYLLSGHLDGQLPFAAMNRRPQKNDAVIGKCQEWIAENYGCANPVGMMAERAGLKPRTFARRFQSATGYLPMDYVHALRIEEAKQLIETDGGSIDEIGLKVGYEDPTFFRRLFKRKAGLTPPSTGANSRACCRSEGETIAIFHACSNAAGKRGQGDQGSSTVTLGHRSCHRFAAMRAAYCALRTCPREVGRMDIANRSWSP